MSLSFDHFPDSALPASPNMKYVVIRHLPTLVKNIIRDLQEFSLKVNLRERSLCQLYNLIVCAENAIKPHCPEILKSVIYKLILDEEPEIAERAYKIAELLGYFVPTEYLLPLIISHLNDTESRNTPKFVSSGLTAFSAVILHSTKRFPDQLDSFMGKLVQLIVSTDYLQSENQEVLERVLLVTQNLVSAAGPTCKKHQHNIFKILLQLGSVPQMAGHSKSVDQTIEQLAKNCGIANSDDLFSLELAQLLDEMKESYENWDKNTPDRFIFDLLVRRSLHAVVDYWETILMIIAANIENEKEYELRIDMLSLVEHFLLQKELHSTIIFYAEIILKMILMPALTWKAGKPNMAIRKASMVCMIKLVELNIIERDTLYMNITGVWNLIKNAMDDDWSTDMRYASVVFTKHFITYLKVSLTDEDYKGMYPELLKRMDDAQDGIRIEMCRVFEVFFDQISENWSGSLYGYIIKQLFVHLDDSSQAIQDAVVQVLKKAARVQTQDFIKISQEIELKSARPALCKSLTDYAQSLKK